MASPPSGHKVRELLVIDAEDFLLTIKGPSNNKIVESFHLHLGEAGERKQAKLTISQNYNYVQVYDPTVDGGLSDFNGDEVYPCFFEQTNYELVIEKKGYSQNIEIDHLNQYLKRAITPTGRKGSILSGIINFQDEVGFSRFVILGGGQPLLSFELEVFPAKIDYQRDFWQLLQDVNDEVYNLAYDFLMRTSFSGALKADKAPTLAEFFSIFNALSLELFKSLERVRDRPHHKIVPINRIVSSAKAKRPDRKTANWLVNRTYLFEKDPEGFDLESGYFFPRRILDNKKELTFDTYENRFLKWMLEQIDRKLNSFGERYKEWGGKTGDKRVAERVATVRRRIRQFYGVDFLKDVGRIERVEHYSLVMQMAPGYRDVYKYYLMLLKGLHIQSDLFNLSLKNMAELYEYWCFLKLNALLRKKYKLKRNGLIKFDRSGINVILKKGQESSIVYKEPKNDEEFTITYNRFFTRLPTLTQRPDNVLKLEKKGSKVNYCYIFDAKYRLKAEDDYIKTFGQAGPPEDTINSMHRYRDAIVAEMGDDKEMRRDIFGAFVLFPHNDEMAYAGKKGGKPCKFYESLREVGVGALPFLPNRTLLVEELLDELILETSESAFERTIIQDGAKDYLLEDKRDVLIGPLKEREQLRVCLENSMYYTYLNRIQSFLGELKYICIYQSKAKFREPWEQGIFYYGKIKDFKIRKRGDIRELSDGRWPERLAVRFQVDEWKRREYPIMPAGYGPIGPQRTSFRLFKEASIYPELHLNIIEVRLWRELRRLQECVTVKFPKRDINESDRVELMEFPGLYIEVQSNDAFKFRTAKGERKFYFNMLDRKPRKVLREVISFWRESV